MRASRVCWSTLAALTILFATALGASAQNNERYTIPNSRSSIANAVDMGPEDASKQITVYVWLSMRSGQSLSDTVEELYDPNSASYQKWLTADQITANFAPSQENVSSVRAFLAGHGLNVSEVGDRNLYVKAQGSIGNVQKAFDVEIHKFSMNGRAFRANTTDPVIEDAAGAFVSRVGGLSDFRMQSHAVRAIDPSTGKPVAAQKVSTSPNGVFFSPNCLQGVDVENFTTDGSLPKATYVGNAYGAPATNTAKGSLPPCGYQPSDLQTAYSFNALYKEGLNGAKQTVAIVDAWGSPTITTDAAAFTSFYGLPPLNMAVYPLGTACAPDPTTMTTEADCASWSVETSLDVEWTHSVAQGANVALVEAASDFTDDLNAGILYALDNHLGNVISCSFGLPESIIGLPTDDPFGSTLLMAAAEGIDVNFSSGDEGDWSTILGYRDVSYPASSPYATGVGGTSLFLNRDKTLGFQTGWGDNFTQISNPPDAKGFTPPLVPPDSSLADGLGFNFGAGGGQSGVFRKPSFQNGLPGRFRLVPDIGYLADPQTGVEVFCAASSCFGVPSSDIFVGLVGGTSLACPMFSSVWTIAIEKAGHPLGQAARSIYNLPANTISDIVPEGSPLDAAGIIETGKQPIYEGPYQLVQPETPEPFLSALFEGTDGAWFVVSFGTDTSLTTNRGWDDVTGLGTPNAPAFVNAVAGHHDRGAEVH